MNHKNCFTCGLPLVSRDEVIPIHVIGELTNHPTLNAQRVIAFSHAYHLKD